MTALTVPQPEYRALMLFDQIPEGCTAFLCTDNYSMPHIRPGETVVVDTRDRTPRQGEVYVIQWQSGRRNICQARICKAVKSEKNPDEVLWSVGSLRTLGGRATVMDWLEKAQALAEKTGVMPIFPGWSDGWWNSGQLAAKLVGCVVGIYAPDFEGPTRAA